MAVCLFYLAAIPAFFAGAAVIADFINLFIW